MVQSPKSPAVSATAELTAFMERWNKAEAQERANYALFLSELCSVLGLPKPDPAGRDTANNAYVFERVVPLHQRDGKTTSGFIDLYKRGCFVLEAKQYGAPKTEPRELGLALQALGKTREKSAIMRGSEAWDEALLAARGQAERYARSLPAEEEPPPFLIVVDVGHVFELYADFTQKGKAYLPFPDARTHRIRLADLAKDDVRERLRLVWTTPLALDPARKSAEVTRDVARHLAELAKSFEEAGHDPKVVAGFLSRCLFCMFAEDVGLLPSESFSSLLESLRDNPGGFPLVIEALFKEMDKGTKYSIPLRQKLLHFNGGLFSETTALPVNGTQLGLLKAAAALDWKHVEPAIFGTLLERALSPAERHKLGAHYTPRAYVERLVLPTVIEPLREEWQAVRAAAVTRASRDDLKAAIAEVRKFHHQLCGVRVLDPACGSGNFLYVTLEHMKRLEGEIFEMLSSLGDSLPLDLRSETVDPHQFLGLEINPRAATVAELVLWIGYLQWHFRTRGEVLPAEPVLRKFANIEHRDAVLAYDREEFAKDVYGKIKYAWDRTTTKVDPVTGRDVPDERKVLPLKTYVKPRPAAWPKADYIVGNPPFIGTARMREELGDGYTEALRATYPDIPESANFVMYWWHKAARETLAGRAKQFGFISTNAIRQTFNRRVVQNAMDEGLYLAFAIPDHPWVDTADGAAVRIAMTVGATARPKAEARLCRVIKETAKEDGEHDIQVETHIGVISPDLTLGANAADTVPLQANEGLTSRGVILFGDGFMVSSDLAKSLGLGKIRGFEKHIRNYRHGRDLTDKPRHMMVVDFFGLTEAEARRNYPKAYQHILAAVKPDRDQNRDTEIRRNWWLFGRPRPELRSYLTGLPRYIATVETSKHRFFQFLDADILPDNMLVVFGLDDAFHLGVLSSRIHVVYALGAGGRLGYGNDPRYNKTRCFDPFPFPDCTAKQKEKIRALAEELDTHRKRVQARHGLGMTAIYNVLEKLRAGTALTPEEKIIHDHALVSTLKQLHDDLDATVAAAYGWPWPLADSEILERVVALNAQRAAEEARGLIRWLRPEFQKSRLAKGGSQQEIELAGRDAPAQPRKGRAAKAVKQPWPKALPARTSAVREILNQAAEPLTAAQVAAHFRRADVKLVADILGTLVTLGLARPGSVQHTFVA